MQFLCCAHFDKQTEMGLGGFDLACVREEGAAITFSMIFET